MTSDHVANILIDGVPFEHHLGDIELAATLKQLRAGREHTNELLSMLSAAISEGTQAAQTKLTEELLGCPKSHLVFAVEANKKMTARKRGTLEDCLEAAEIMDLGAPVPEVVEVYPQPKKSGGFRVIHSHGLLHRSAQEAVKQVMQPHFRPRPFQYGHVGVPNAIRFIQSGIKADHLFVAKLDVKNFYPSFIGKKLGEELPLPRGTVGHVVIGRHHDYVVGKANGGMSSGKSVKGSSGDDVLYLGIPDNVVVSQARLGVPQGSTCSPIVGSFCGSKLAWSPTPDVKLVNYVDDYFLLATSAQALEAAIEELVEAVGELPGGHFELVLKSSCHVDDGLEFLGHAIRRIDGVLKTWPAHFNVDHLVGEVMKIDNRISNIVYAPGKFSGVGSHEVTQLLARMCSKIEGWVSAFSACDDPVRNIKPVIAGFYEWLGKLNLSLANVESAIDPNWPSAPSIYSLGK